MNSPQTENFFFQQKVKCISMLNGILIINSKNILISLNPDSKGNIKKKAG